MTNIIKPKRSNTALSVPTISDLADGELAVNSADKKIYLRQGSNIVQIANASVPDQSVILDDISSLFNGSTTQFTISDASGNFINSQIDTAARLLISVGGIVQQPDPSQTAGFFISGGTDRSTDPIKINFVEAPKSGQAFFGVAIKSTNSPTTSFVTTEESISHSIVFGV